MEFLRGNRAPSDAKLLYGYRDETRKRPVGSRGTEGMDHAAMRRGGRDQLLGLIEKANALAAPVPEEFNPRGLKRLPQEPDRRAAWFADPGLEAVN